MPSPARSSSTLNSGSSMRLLQGRRPCGRRPSASGLQLRPSFGTHTASRGFSFAWLQLRTFSFGSSFGNLQLRGSFGFSFGSPWLRVSFGFGSASASAQLRLRIPLASGQLQLRFSFGASASLQLRIASASASGSFSFASTSDLQLRESLASLALGFASASDTLAQSPTRRPGEGAH